jgi:4-carboxymuconolactone decarboxylase
LQTRLNEFVMLIVARQWSQQFDFCDELFWTRGVSDATYRSAIDRFGEQGVIDMLGLIGYFTTVSMVMNVAHTPPPDDPSVSPLGVLPP